MTVALTPAPVFQGIGFGGFPLPGGKLFTYVAGTATPQATYTDSTGLVQNGNPTILNANGQANVWFVVGQTYKVILQDAFGNQIYSVDNILGGGTAASIIALLTANFLGGILYPQTAAELAAGVTPINYFYQPGWIDRYGTNAIPGTTDMLPAINNAILQAAQPGGQPVIAQGTTYFHSAGITMKWNVSVRGAGKGQTTFSSNHTGYGIKTTGVVNAPSGGFTEIRDCRFINSNVSNTDGGIVDLTGTEILVSNVSVLGFAYSVIFNQTELGDIDLCDLTNFLIGGVWLVNGTDYLPWVASPGFTNRISVRRSQINGGLGGIAHGIGVIDDGGAVHTFADNNLNLCASHYRLAGTDALRIATSEHESSSGNNINFFTTTSVNGTSVGVNNNVVIEGGLWSPPAVVAAMGSAVVNISVTNIRSLTSAPAFTGAANCNTIIAYGNQDSGTGQLFDGIAAAVHLEIDVASGTSRFKNTNNAFTGSMGFNGATPVGASAGWGTPTGPATVANFSGSAATLVQCSNAIAQIITYLKSRGDFAA